MKTDAGKWLTLSEVIRKSKLEDIEARPLVKKLGNLLSPRNFGDIVKYPAPVADLLARFSILRRQGWTIEDLKNLLIRSRQKIQEECRAQKPDLLVELRQESATLLKNLEIVINFGSRMQETLQSLAGLLGSMDSLIAHMRAQEKDPGELRTEGSMKEFPSGSTNR
jgi:DNA-binding transcriptional MerR regulator